MYAIIVGIQAFKWIPQRESFLYTWWFSFVAFIFLCIFFLSSISFLKYSCIYFECRTNIYLLINARYNCDMVHWSWEWARAIFVIVWHCNASWVFALNSTQQKQQLTFCNGMWCVWFVHLIYTSFIVCFARQREWLSHWCGLWFSIDNREACLQN